jgi:hypothetical protein
MGDVTVASMPFVFIMQAGLFQLWPLCSEGRLAPNRNCKNFSPSQVAVELNR